MSEQKALVLDKPNGSFVVSTRPIPKPATGELLVKVQAAGLNPVDWKIQAGPYAWLAQDSYPAVLGSDIAGDVEEVGEGVEKWKKGDRVYFQGRYGTNDYTAFQQYTLISAELVGKIPERYSYSQAASIPVAFMAAVFGLYAPKPAGLALNPTLDSSVKFTGQPALVIGGSTSVGQFAIQLFRQLGFSPIIAYASKSHESHLRQLGATHIIDRRSVSFADLPTAISELLPRLTSSPLKIVYDAFSGHEAQKAAYDSLTDGGDVITVNPDQIKPEEKVDGTKNVLVVLASVHLPQVQDWGRQLWKVLEKWVEDGIIVPARVEDLPNGLKGIAEGLERLRSGTVSGVKLVGHPQEGL